MGCFVRHRRSAARAGAAVALLAITVAACGGGGSQPAPTATPRLQLTACKVSGLAGARCGTLIVPENPANPNGRQIPIHVSVLPATASTRMPDPLFYFAGYGGAASESAAWAATTFARLHETRDIVLVDQRGTGLSNRMECTTLQALTPSTPESTVHQVVKDCLAATAAQGDPRFYTTPLAVDDIDAVRAALGYDRIDIYGVSYGVSSGLAYIQRHERHVRTAVFDSGSLLDVRLWESGARSTENAMHSVLRRCAADARCNIAYPHASDELETVVARLTANPVTITLPRGGGTAVLDGALLLTALSNYLGDVQTAAKLPRAVHQAFTGDWAALTESYQPPSSSAPDTRWTLISSRTIGCSDEWARTDPARVASYGAGPVATAMTVAIAKGRNAVCAVWPTATGSSGAVHTTAPVVFLNGAEDPADPPENVSGARATMPNSLSVVVPGYEHGQLSEDPTGLLAMEATTFIQLGRPSTMDDWPAARTPVMPPFATG